MITNEHEFIEALASLDNPVLRSLLVYVHALIDSGDEALGTRMTTMEGRSKIQTALFGNGYELLKFLSPFILVGIGILIGTRK